MYEGQKMKTYETKKEMKSGDIIRLNLAKGTRLYDYVKNLKTMGKGYQSKIVYEILADTCEGEPLDKKYLTRATKGSD